jgi:hypothetical protein
MKQIRIKRKIKNANSCQLLPQEQLQHIKLHILYDFREKELQNK